MTLPAPEDLRSSSHVLEEFGRCDPIHYHELWADRLRFANNGKIRLASVIGTLLGLGASIQDTDLAHDAATDLHKKLFGLSTYGGQCDGCPAYKIEVDASTSDPFTFSVAWYHIYAAKWLNDEVERLMDCNSNTFTFRCVRTRDALETAVMHGQGIDQTMTETRFPNGKLTRYYYRQRCVGGLIPTYSSKPGQEGLVIGWSIHT